nr:G protein-coupled receptor [Proales similis]
MSANASSAIYEQTSYTDYFDPSFPKWISIVLLVIGLIGNTLCLLIFQQQQMRKNSTFTYLAFLAVVDLFVLLFGLGDIILISYFKFVLRNQSIVICRVHSFLTYAFTHLSSFTLAAVSIDRAIATNLLNFAKKYCQPSTAYKVIAFNIVLAAVMNMHSLLFLGSYDLVVGGPNQSSRLEFSCASKAGSLYEHFMDPFFKWIDLLLYAIIPTTTMAICTFLIIRTLLKTNRRMASRRAKSTLTRKSAEPTESDQVDQKLIKSMHSQQERKAAKAKHLTYTLITLNTLFFSLTTPLVICLIFFDDTDNRILLNIVYLLSYSNHSINFIMYCFSSPPYRHTLFNFFSSGSQSSPTAY